MGLMVDEKDRVQVVDHRDDGFLMAQYGNRQPHIACPFCTTDEQIYFVTEMDGVLTCMECGLSANVKKEVPEYFYFSVNDGKPHITLEKDNPPIALTGREFDKSDDVEFLDVESIDPDEVCTFCRKRFEEEYGELD